MQHYTKTTVQVEAWCSKCSKNTPHRVLGGKLAGCMTCEARPSEPVKAKPAPRLREKGLFDE